MRIDREAVCRGHFVLELLYVRIEELPYGPAPDTDQMIVMSVELPALEADETVVQLDRLGKLCGAQELERPIYRAASDVGMFFVDGTVQLIDRDMSFRFEKGSKNDLTLPGMLQPVRL